MQRENKIISLKQMSFEYNAVPEYWYESLFIIGSLNKGFSATYHYNCHCGSIMSKNEKILISNLNWKLLSTVFLLEIIDVVKFLHQFMLTEWLFFFTFADKGDLLNVL